MDLNLRDGQAQLPLLESCFDLFIERRTDKPGIGGAGVSSKRVSENLSKKGWLGKLAG